MTKTDQTADKPSLAFLAKDEIKELQDDHDNLCDQIKILKKDMKDWRCTFAKQNDEHNKVLTDLREKLDKDVQNLRGEFQNLRAKIRNQLEETAGLADRERRET
ncbi:hypothetical protein BSKO_07750 [Bryopsis sp. KO-2023]|nr:hypothetical protein BSKO_07750 [Bryopsis sp. KO-2023]